MRKAALLILLALLISSCGLDRDAGRRYRAERDLWRADWEYQNFSIRPEEVGDERWGALAGRYEAIADQYATGSSAGEPGSALRGIQALAARALFSAAQIHVALRDSNRVELLYERMAADFGQLPEVAAEVALIRGGIAERRGDRLAAAELYESVIGRVEPEAHVPGVAGVVLDLPLRVARLRGVGLAGPSREAAYAAARAYYEPLAADPVGGPVSIDAQTRLAEVAADLGRWDEALETLRRLEARLRDLEEPSRSPCEIRFAIYGVQSRAGVDLATSRQTLISLLEEYPDCELGPQVLLALASNASRRGQESEALAYLDRISAVYAENLDVASQTMLIKGRLLESLGRWPEALAALRGIAIQFPLSEAALRAPLEIVLHHARAGDDAAAAEALSQAERDYRDFISRYPPGPLSVVARENLVQTLSLQGKHDAAVTELVRLGDDLVGSTQGASLLLAAARMAYADLGDTARAAGILDHAGQVYARTGVGRWAVAEAARLRGTSTP